MGELVKNERLNTAVFLSGMHQGEIAEKARIPRTYISMAIHGRLIFSNAEKQRIAEVLGKQVRDLFDY